MLYSEKDSSVLDTTSDIQTVVQFKGKMVEQVKSYEYIGSSTAQIHHENHSEKDCSVLGTTSYIQSVVQFKGKMVEQVKSSKMHQLSDQLSKQNGGERATRQEKRSCLAI